MTAGRSGACYDDTAPSLHAICSGRYTRWWPTSSPEERTCNCPCHTPGTLLNALADKARPILAGRSGGCRKRAA
jgi:hypothetical protein